MDAAPGMRPGLVLATLISTKMNPADLYEQFKLRFGRAPQGSVRAPGRVNLIGEHTDYNNGFVLPIAINRYTTAAFARTGDNLIRIVSCEADGQVQFDLRDAPQTGDPAWGNYCIGVAAGLIERGCELVGLDILLSSDVPVGSGLSSSAALEVAVAFALLAGADAVGSVPDRELALLCQRAENEYAGAPCGIMDQTIAVMGQAGKATLLDCKDGSTRQIPFDNPELTLLVADTQVSHAIGGSEYAQRRQQCASAAESLGVRFLREVDVTALACEALTEIERKRARHVVTEIARTIAAAENLQAGDYQQFGRLMLASHESLRDDFEVSCPELDAIVAAAKGAEGVYGARMTGGGFGGCAIILARADRAEAITKTIQDDFAAKFNRHCHIFATSACQGAHVIK